VIHLATSKESVVLDSFSGSGATGHAVLEASKGDGGNRRFLLVEMVRCIPRYVMSLLIE
jgi:adenine-specific DNA-methyltransferase